MSKEAFFEYLKVFQSSPSSNIKNSIARFLRNDLLGKIMEISDFVLWAIAIAGVVSILILFKNNIVLDLSGFKAEIWVPALTTLLVGASALYAAGKNIQKMQVQINLQEEQIKEQKAFIEAESKREMLSNYIEIENLPTTVKNRSMSLQQKLRDLTEGLENLATTEKIELAEAFNRKPEGAYREYFLKMLREVRETADFKIEIPKETKIFLSRETRKAIGNINSRFAGVRDSLQYRIDNFSTLKGLNFKGYGLLYHHYDSFTKPHIDEFTYGVEELRRKAEGMAPINEFSEWKKGVEVIPSGENYILKYHRYPRMTATFKSKTSPKSNDFFEFTDVESAGIDEVEYIKAHLNMIPQGLAVMNINTFDEAAPYFDLYHKHIGSVDRGYVIHVIRPL